MTDVKPSISALSANESARQTDRQNARKISFVLQKTKKLIIKADTLRC